MRRLVDSAELSRDDLVLEVGPGTGGLTDLLCKYAGRVFSIEIDRDMLEILADRYRGFDHVTIVGGDALRTKHCVAESISNAIEMFHGVGHGAVKLVSNLPYQIATPLVMNLVVSFPAVRRLCFTVQAEVGDRLVASSGLKDYGPLAIVTQTLCTIETIARVGPGAFWPRPAVDSVMIRMIPGASPFESPAAARRFSMFVRGVFEHRRKTLRAALEYVVEEETRERLARDFDLSQRPEQVPVHQWVEMSCAAF